MLRGHIGKTILPELRRRTMVERLHLNSLFVGFGGREVGGVEII
jgi:hypothetical protein